MPTISDLPLSSPAYGGDWNPEQWFDDPGFHQIIDQDLALMRQAGVNLVTLGVFAWARLEPREGEYDLDWMEHILNRCAHEGVMVDLATGTASPPVWMAQDHPDTLPVDARGVTLGFGSRQQYSPSSLTYRRAAVALVRRLAERFGKHPAVVMWHVGNEYACHVRECFSAESSEAFRQWVKQRYGTIEDVNRGWSTDFWSQRLTDFSQVRPPAAMPTFANPAQVLDWRRFTDHQFRSLYLAEAETIRQYSDRPITTNFMGAFPALDYRAWAPHVDLVADDSYPDPADPTAGAEIAFAGDLMRGLAGGKPWFLMEQSPSAVQWRTRNSPKRPGQFLLWSLARIAHGADAILQFQWRQSKGGAETFHAGMVPHSGEASRTWDEVVQTGDVLKRLGPVMGERITSHAAIVVDWESEWARQAAIGPSDEVAYTAGRKEVLFPAARAWHRSLWEAGYHVDCVGPQGDLSAYSLVIVPEVFIDRPELAASLEAVASAGGQVLVAGPSAVVTPTMEAIRGGYCGSLRPLLGVAVADHAALTGRVEIVGPHERRSEAASRITRGVSVPSACDWLGLDALAQPLRRALERMGPPTPDLRAGSWAEEIVGWSTLDTGAEGAESAQGAHIRICDAQGGHALPYREGLPADVEVIATFDGRGGGSDIAGRPAITRRRVGKTGGAWYVACDLDALSRSAVLDVLTAHARLRPVVAGLPDGVEASQRGPFLFLLNHSDRAVELTGIVGTDLVTGAASTGHVVLAARSGMVVDQR